MRLGLTRVRAAAPPPPPPPPAIKSKMQGDSLSNPQYRNTMDCVRQSVAVEGTKGLFRGECSSPGVVLSSHSIPSCSGA